MQVRNSNSVILPHEIIKKKRDGHPLSKEEIQYFISAFTAGEIPDYQMAALLMAIYFKGMNSEESAQLTHTMLHSGLVLDLKHIQGSKVDKHSTGGVGDKTSLILAPIAAVAGLKIPMIAGRGLAHTGGTLDKLESIPGFSIDLSIEQCKKNLEKFGVALIGQTKEICPADKKIYALRDVTSTVDSLPLICASIMSKKLAEGIDALVLDVKYGSGAFMKDSKDSETLAHALMDIAKAHGVRVAALITNMDQPLGLYAGNSLEIEECLAILQNKQDSRFEDTRMLSLRLAAHMLWLGGLSSSAEEGFALAEKILLSGRAHEKFVEICNMQGGDLSKLPKPKNKLEVCAASSGFVQKIDTESLGYAGVMIKAGRAKTSDVIEPTAGMEFHKKVGEPVVAGEPLVTLYGADPSLLQGVHNKILESYIISEKKTAPRPLILKTLV